MAARVTTLLIRLSGADPKILRLVPEETPKFASLGGIILSMAALACVSMFFGLAISGVSPWVAAPGAVLWSLVVAGSDRLLVTALQRDGGRPRKIALAVLQLVLAVLLGVTTSTPLVLMIFKPEIEAELAVRGDQAGSGLLARLDALKTIGEHYPSANVAQYALLLFFGLISVLPVLTRILGLFGPPSRYNRVAVEERTRFEALRNIARTRAEMTVVEREVADRLTELLIALGPPARSSTDSSGDDLDGGRS